MDTGLLHPGNCLIAKLFGHSSGDVATLGEQPFKDGDPIELVELRRDALYVFAVPQVARQLRSPNGRHEFVHREGRKSLVALWISGSETLTLERMDHVPELMC